MDEVTASRYLIHMNVGMWHGWHQFTWVKYKSPNNSEVQLLNYFTRLNRANSANHFCNHLWLYSEVYVHYFTTQLLSYMLLLVHCDMFLWSQQFNCPKIKRPKMFSAALFSLSVVRSVLSSECVSRVKPFSKERPSISLTTFT